GQALQLDAAHRHTHLHGREVEEKTLGWLPWARHSRASDDDPYVNSRKQESAPEMCRDWAGQALFGCSIVSSETAIVLRVRHRVAGCPTLVRPHRREHGSPGVTRRRYAGRTRTRRRQWNSDTLYRSWPSVKNCISAGPLRVCTWPSPPSVSRSSDSNAASA